MLGCDMLFVNCRYVLMSVFFDEIQTSLHWNKISYLLQQRLKNQIIMDPDIIRYENDKIKVSLIQIGGYR